MLGLPEDDADMCEVVALRPAPDGLGHGRAAEIHASTHANRVRDSNPDLAGYFTTMAQRVKLTAEQARGGLAVVDMTSTLSSRVRLQPRQQTNLLPQR